MIVNAIISLDSLRSSRGGCVCEDVLQTTFGPKPTWLLETTLGLAAQRRQDTAWLPILPTQTLLLSVSAATPKLALLSMRTHVAILCPPGALLPIAE